MSRLRRRRPRRDGQSGRATELPERPDSIDPSSTGAEAAYLRSLIDSRTSVIVVLNTGGQLRGRIRYFDRDCFSIGLADRRLNIFLRKSSVRYIYEETRP